MLVILISILISALALGIGHAFNIKKLWFFGTEELAQAIVSSALLGVLALIVSSLSASLVAFGAQGPCQQDSTTIDYAICSVREQSSNALEISQLAYKASSISGFAGSLQVHLGIVSSSPFSSLSFSSEELFHTGSNFSLLYSAASSQESALSLISSKALVLFFPAGLFLRSFFATRKAGAAIMALCVSLYVFLPLLLATLLSSFSGNAHFEEARLSLSEYYARFSFLPQTDFEKEASLKDTVNSLAQGDFASQTDLLFKPLGAYLGQAFNSLVLFPAISIVICLVLARELYIGLSSPLVFWRDA
ncbi:hypothetical protein J4441_04705 [Candidatus Micrarchaeota archaeon]|nr:hypothetical protein [Candidatus Micrarchaeota archaeon]